MLAFTTLCCIINVSGSDIYMYFRETKEIVENVSKTFKVLFVFGPRGVGKTTLLLSLKPDNMEYITLDDEVLREQAKSDPKLFLEEHPAPFTY
mgnify:CR=1 FL=1